MLTVHARHKAARLHSQQEQVTYTETNENEISKVGLSLFMNFKLVY
jgi:hypothetical protein